MEDAKRSSRLRAEKGGASDDFAGCYTGRLALRRADITYQGALCLCRSLLISPDRLAASILSVEECRHFDGLRFEKRRRSWVMGRYAAKKAISLLSGEKPGQIHIGYGVFNNPLIDSFGEQGRLETSISHTSEIAAALAFPASHPMGIDIERVDPAKTAIIEHELTRNEIGLLKSCAAAAQHEYAVLLTAAWTMKEALSKVFRTGLMTPISVYEITALESEAASLVAHFDNFGQYKAITFSLGDHVCSLACPKKTHCQFDLDRLRVQLS